MLFGPHDCCVITVVIVSVAISRYKGNEPSVGDVSLVLKLVASRTTSQREIIVEYLASFENDAAARPEVRSVAMPLTCFQKDVLLHPWRLPLTCFLALAGWSRGD
jgi:hypothetical protein